MKASFNKTTWFKITTILVVGTFVFQANAYALSYHKQDILPDDAWAVGFIGFGVTMLMPFVPVAAEGIGSAVGLSESGTKVLGAVMGAGLGATPGIVAEDDTCAIIGGITGGLSGYFSTSNYIKVKNSAPSTFNPMQQYANNLGIAISTQIVSSTLTDVAVHDWKWEPKHAYALGMLGGSVTGWTMASAMPSGQEMMRDMYQNNPNWADWVTPEAETFAPWKAGLVTGLGLGSIQAGIDIYLSNILEDTDIPDSAKYRLASLGSNTLGSLAWGGIAGGTEGIKSVANDQFYNSIIRQGLSIYISWKVEEDWGWEPEKASILGSSASMLLANLQIWPAGRAERVAAKELQDEAASKETLGEYYESYKARRGQYPPEMPTEYDIETKRWDKSPEDLRAEAEKKLRNHSLRQPTPITSKVGWDAVLEPLIFYGVSSLATDLSKDRAGEYKTGADLIVYNLAAMNLASLTHAWLVTAVNKQGWYEFGQVYMSKTRDFQGDLFSFGSRVFGAKTSGRKEEAIGAFNIYGAAQRNSQMWNLAGLSGYDAVRAPKTSTPSGLFTAIGSHAGRLAGDHTVRNLEGLSYTAIKDVAPYTLERVVSSEMYEKIKAQGEGALEEANRWIKESSYPAYFSAAEGVCFPGWRIGDVKDTEKLMLQNTITGIKYPLTPEVLRKLNVNRPFEYGPRTETPPASVGIGVGGVAEGALQIGSNTIGQIRSNASVGIGIGGVAEGAAQIGSSTIYYEPPQLTPDNLPSY